MEVPYWFHMPASYSTDFVDIKSVPVVIIGNEKNSFTAELSCLSSENKLLPMTVFKIKTIQKESFPKEIIVLANPKGWMNQTMMQEWAMKC